MSRKGGKAKGKSSRSSRSKTKGAAPQKMKKRIWKHQGR